MEGNEAWRDGERHMCAPIRNRTSLIKFCIFLVAITICFIQFGAPGEAQALPPRQLSTQAVPARCYNDSCQAVSKSEVTHFATQKKKQPKKCTLILPQTKEELQIPCEWSLIPGSWWSKKDQCYYWYSTHDTQIATDAKVKSGEYSQYHYYCVDSHKYKSQVELNLLIQRLNQVFATGVEIPIFSVPLRNEDALPAGHPRKLALEASARLTFPNPNLHFRWHYAPEDKNLMRLILVKAPFWWWAPNLSQWKPLTATAHAGDAWTTVTATAQGWTFHPGNGDNPHSCNGPGTPWPHNPEPNFGLHSNPPSGCSYTYRHTSINAPNEKFTIHWTMNWTITWKASDGTKGTLPTQHITSTTTRIPVGEAQTLVTH